MQARALRAHATAVVVLAAAAVLLALPSAGGASGRELAAQNGEIAFIRNMSVYTQGGLFVANPDGSGARRLIKSGWVSSAAWSRDGKRLAIGDYCEIKVLPAAGGPIEQVTRRDRRGRRCDVAPAWSPDGKRLVFVRIRVPLGSALSAPLTGVRSWLYVVNANGRGLRQLTPAGNWGQFDLLPHWSPDGKRIIFTRRDNTAPDPPHGNWANNSWTYVMNSDGSDLGRLGSPQAWGPKWSPDGSRIAFIRLLWTTLPPGASWTGSVVVMNADGSGEKTLVREDQGGGRQCHQGGWSVDWSPDGTKLAYTGPCLSGIYVTNPDGTGTVRITTGADGRVSWRPLP